MPETIYLVSTNIDVNRRSIPVTADNLESAKQKALSLFKASDYRSRECGEKISIFITGPNADVHMIEGTLS